MSRREGSPLCEACIWLAVAVMLGIFGLGLFFKFGIE